MPIGLFISTTKRRPKLKQPSGLYPNGLLLGSTKVLMLSPSKYLAKSPPTTYSKILLMNSTKLLMLSPDKYLAQS